MEPHDLPRRAADELTALRSLPLRLGGMDLAGGMLSAFITAHWRRDGILGDLARFLGEWQACSPTMKVRTSGSTGEPKPLRVEKRRMAASARRTCGHLGVPPGTSVLLAMPLDYIAGKMVVVRALVCGLDLVAVEPSASPLRACAEAPFFAALTPMQAWESLRDPHTARLLRDIRHLLLGGGAITPALAKELAAFPNAVWSSYGMTETLSHVALRRLDGERATGWYTPLEGVRVSLTPEGTLRIEDPATCPAPLATNDLAELDAHGRFRVLGRRDNVVDSGGIKIQLERVETALAGVIPGDFCATAVPDDSLGERLVLLCVTPLEDTVMRDLCRPLLPDHWCPRQAYRVDGIPRTGTGKIARAEAKALAERAAARG